MLDVAKVLLIQLDKPHLAGGICSVIPHRVQSKQFKAVTRLCGLQIEFANWPGPGGVGVRSGNQAGSKQGLDGAPQSSACSFHVCAMLRKYLFKYFRWCLTCLQSFCQFPATPLSRSSFLLCYPIVMASQCVHFMVILMVTSPRCPSTFPITLCPLMRWHFASHFAFRVHLTDASVQIGSDLT